LAGQAGKPPPAPPAEEGDWLQDQLTWITDWSQRMQQQITSAEQAERDRDE
jgi:hypothetical protein